MEKPIALIFVLGVRKVTIAAYLRVSTSDKQSVSHQRRSVKRWISKQGYDTADYLEFIDEGYSGSLGELERPGFSALMNAIRKKSLTRVVMCEPSRASRNYVAFLQFLEECSRSACKVEIVGQGEQAFETTSDMLVASIQAFLSAAEREKISQRVKSGMAEAKASGKKFGPRKGEKRRLGKLKTYPEEFINQIKLLHAKGLSSREIAELVGDRWRPGKPYCASSIRKILSKVVD